MILRICAGPLAQLQLEPIEVNPKGQLQELLQYLRVMVYLREWLGNIALMTMLLPVHQSLI